jgi:hypothetical protein
MGIAVFLTGDLTNPYTIQIHQLSDPHSAEELVSAVSSSLKLDGLSMTDLQNTQSMKNAISSVAYSEKGKEMIRFALQAV